MGRTFRMEPLLFISIAATYIICSFGDCIYKSVFDFGCHVDFCFDLMGGL
jgi:hypothetical protein